MSKMGRVVQDIMERFNGNIPEGYTLTDYFRDIENDRIKLGKNPETKEDSTRRSNNDDEDASQS